MEEILKATAIGVVCCIVALVIRNQRAEFSFFVQLGGLVCIIAVAVNLLSTIISYTKSNFASEIIDDSYLGILIKALGIAVLSKLGSDICRDSGSNALAFSVELAAKGGILLLTLPMLKALSDAVGGLLKG